MAVGEFLSASTRCCAFDARGLALLRHNLVVLVGFLLCRVVKGGGSKGRGFPNLP